MQDQTRSAVVVDFQRIQEAPDHALISAEALGFLFGAKSVEAKLILDDVESTIVYRIVGFDRNHNLIAIDRLGGESDPQADKVFDNAKDMPQPGTASYESTDQAVLERMSIAARNCDDDGLVAAAQAYRALH